jgi:hypothetical protein
LRAEVGKGDSGRTWVVLRKAVLAASSASLVPRLRPPLEAAAAALAVPAAATLDDIEALL